MLDAPTITAIAVLIANITALIKIFQAEQQRSNQTAKIEATQATQQQQAVKLEQIHKDTNGTLAALIAENTLLRKNQATPAELAARLAGAPAPETLPQAAGAPHPAA
jgi:hypothetical protein